MAASKVALAASATAANWARCSSFATPSLLSNPRLLSRYVGRMVSSQSTKCSTNWVFATSPSPSASPSLASLLSSLLQILLVVSLRGPELSGLLQFHHDLVLVLGLDLFKEIQRDVLLFLRVVVDATPVLSPPVVALSVEGGRIHSVEEDSQQFFVGDQLGVEEHLDGLSVTRVSVTNILVGRVFSRSRCVADHTAHHSRNPLKCKLDSPETSCCKGGRLRVFFSNLVLDCIMLFCDDLLNLF